MAVEARSKDSCRYNSCPKTGLFAKITRCGYSDASAEIFARGCFSD